MYVVDSKIFINPKSRDQSLRFVGLINHINPGTDTQYLITRTVLVNPVLL